MGCGESVACFRSTYTPKITSPGDESVGRGVCAVQGEKWHPSSVSFQSHTLTHIASLYSIGRR